jgi:Fe-S cluster biogenesis protein NfuA
MIAITIEDTPNINSKKFIPGCMLVNGHRVFDFFKNDDAVKFSPLAKRIFLLPCITQVMIARDFITITREDETVPWFDVEIVVRDTLAQHLRSDEDAVDEIAFNSHEQLHDHPLQDDMDLDFLGPQGEILQDIVHIMETYIQPAVAADGGHIQLRGFKEGIVYLELQGACSSCGSAEMTLKNGIENLLKHYIPEVTGVIRMKK